MREAGISLWLGWKDSLFMLLLAMLVMEGSWATLSIFTTRCRAVLSAAGHTATL